MIKLHERRYSQKKYRVSGVGQLMPHAESTKKCRSSHKARAPLGDRQCDSRNGDIGVDRKNATPKRASIKATPPGAGVALRARSRNKINK